MTTDMQQDTMGDVNDTLSIRGQITRRVYDVDELRSRVDNFDDLSRDEKIELLRENEPTDEETIRNVTVERFHEYFVDNLDPNNTSNVANLSPSHLALGDEAVSGTDTTDTDLNNRLYEEAIDSFDDQGDELVTTVLLASDEGNGNTYNEVGLYTGDPSNLGNTDVFMLNHATFSNFTKDNTKSITFDVSLLFGDA